MGRWGQEGVCNSDAAYLRGMHPATCPGMPRARQWSHGLAVPSALPSSSAEGKSDTESITSRKGCVCFAATGKSEAVPDGNWAELLREKAVPTWRAGELDGGVASLTVAINPMSFKLN